MYNIYVCIIYMIILCIIIYTIQKACKGFLHVLCDFFKLNILNNVLLKKTFTRNVNFNFMLVYFRNLFSNRLINFQCFLLSVTFIKSFSLQPPSTRNINFNFKFKLALFRNLFSNQSTNFQCFLFNVTFFLLSLLEFIPLATFYQKALKIILIGCQKYLFFVVCLEV